MKTVPQLRQMAEALRSRVNMLANTPESAMRCREAYEMGRPCQLCQAIWDADEADKELAAAEVAAEQQLARQVRADQED